MGPSPEAGPVARAAGPLSRLRGLLPLGGLLASLLLGCSGPPGPEAGEDGDGGSGARIHRVVLGGRGDRDDLRPRRISVRPGDLVEIRISDGRPHALGVLGEGLTPAARAFLQATGQDGAVLLVERDARLVLSFQGAPRGSYRVGCLSHPGSRPVLVVVGE